MRHRNIAQLVERRTENPQAQGRDLVFRFGEIKKQKHLVGKYAGWVFLRQESEVSKKILSFLVKQNWNKVTFYLDFRANKQHIKQ